jgi:hypothetical protein
MPNWRIHFYVAEKVANSLEVKNMNDFLIGCVLPDCPWFELDNYCDKFTQIRNRLHYLETVGEGKLPAASYISFVKKYHNDIKESDLAKGIFTHLICDRTLNTSYYKYFEYIIETSDCTVYGNRQNYEHLTNHQAQDLKRQDMLYTAFNLDVHSKIDCGKISDNVKEIIVDTAGKDYCGIEQIIDRVHDSVYVSPNAHLMVLSEEECIKIIEDMISKCIMLYSYL